MNRATENLTLKERLHYRHRFLRYRFRTEPDTVHFIREEVKPGQVVLDIGANKGIVTWFLGKQVGPKGRVLAFEPQPEMVPQIERVARSFGLANVEVHGIGLSDRADQASLFRGEAGSTANLVAGRDWQQEELEIDVVTLDSFAEEHGLDAIDFIKCDVDGYELPVLRGATRVLTEQGPDVLIEVTESALPEVSEIFRDLDYDGGTFFHRGSRFPASETGNHSYRHEGAEFRNFLFRKA